MNLPWTKTQTNNQSSNHWRMKHYTEQCVFDAVELDKSLDCNQIEVVSAIIDQISRSARLTFKIFSATKLSEVSYSSKDVISYLFRQLFLPDTIKMCTNIYIYTRKWRNRPTKFSVKGFLQKQSMTKNYPKSYSI